MPNQRGAAAPPQKRATAQIFEVLIGNQRREQPQDSIFANNPFVDGFFEWMGSREGQQCIEVHDVLWDLLKDVQIDAKQRQLIWPDAERLDLEQSIQRIQKLYPDFPRDEVEEFVLNWIDMGYYPENYSQAQLRRNSTSLTASQSNGSPTISERAQKNERELGTLS